MKSNTKYRYSLKKPPSGAWIEKSATHLRFGVSTKSKNAFFVAPFMTLWSVLGFSGLLKEQYDLAKLHLFHLPIIILAIALSTFSLIWLCMSIAGKVEFTVTRTGGTIFKGVGGIGIKKSFLWEDVIWKNKKIKFGHFHGTKREDYLTRTFNYALKRVKYKEDF